MAFNKLPLELNQWIAECIENDRDLCNFRLVCLNTRYAVDGDDLKFWRRRFLQHFDRPARKCSNQKFKELYQQRRQCLRHGMRMQLKSGSTRTEKKCLEVLRDLFVESFPGTTNELGEPTSKNYDWLEHFIYGTNILTDVFRPLAKAQQRSQLLLTLQLVFSHWSLDPSFGADTYSFDESQKAVYESTTTVPIFGGFNNFQVNISFLLHVSNFFKYHTTREAEHTLYETFSNLADGMKPRAWQERPKEGPVKLGKHWKGTYAYIERDEIHNMRAWPAGEFILPDSNVDHGERAIQSLVLDFPTPGKEPVWPKAFEDILHSLPRHLSAKTRAQHRLNTAPVGEAMSFRFSGYGYDEEQLYSSGWLNPLPPQHGIPGWQRMTMMKYFVDESGSFDGDALWAYEGVVLPGGQIMLGRWWSPDDDEPPNQVGAYSGPFIFWNVEDDVQDDDEDAEAKSAGTRALAVRSH